MDDELALLLLLGVLALIAGPVLAIIALVKLGGAHRRIEMLETRIAQLLQRLTPLEAARAATATPPEAAPDAPPSDEATAPAGPWTPSRPPAPPAPAQAASSPSGPPPVWQDPEAQSPERAAAPPTTTPRPPGAASRLLAWLSANWVYAVSAMSLALAGVFFVQYGIEAGLLPPAARVLAGLLFGLGLIAGGEWLRKRFGADEAAASTRYLPSVFSGAGLVALFAALTAGRMMYGLYGPGMAFAGLALTALGAVWLGWRNGPFLAAIGLIGGAAAPFLVAGGGAPGAWLYGYYLLILAVGLAVDAWRLWGWVSLLALALAQGGMLLMRLADAGVEPWLMAQIATVVLAVALPGRSLTPRHAGPMASQHLLGWLRAKGAKIWPDRPVLLALIATLTSVLQIFALQLDGPPPATALAGLMPYLALSLMALILLWWTAEAEALQDLALLPALGFLARLALDAPLQALWLQQTPDRLPPETSALAWTAWLLLMATAIGAAAAWRALWPQTGSPDAAPEAGGPADQSDARLAFGRLDGARLGLLGHSLAAVLVAPVAVLILEALWTPARVIGAFPWALQVIALAAAMVGLASAFARRDGGPGRRFAWATLSALSLIAAAVFILTAEAALTLALGVLLVVAVALDRRFRLPEMGWFVQAAALVLSYRLVVDPGIFWADSAPLSALLVSHLGLALAAFAAWRLLPETRALPQAVLESLGAAALALLANMLLMRAIVGRPQTDGSWSPDYTASHWGATLHALPWLILGASQLWRAAATAGLGRRLRLGVAALAGGLGGLGLLAAVTLFNPLFDLGPSATARVLGPPVLDSLALAYAVPGLLLLAAARPRLLGPRLYRLPLFAGSALMVLYVVCEIRRLWQGPEISGPGVLQGELYSYTLALLLTGAALLWQALARRSVPLRRLAMAVIALTVAKVFLWDVSGLSGLVRVLSFAGLGLSLAALAWLNRWAGASMDARR